MQAATTGVLDSYKRTEIETASPAKLLILLYDAAIRRLETAAEATRIGKFERSHQDLLKVQDILTELMVSLDWEAENAPVAQLYSLYEYMYRGLVKANIKRIVEPIEEALGIMTDLRETWEQAIRQVGADGELPAQAPQQRRLNLTG